MSFGRATVRNELSCHIISVASKETVATLYIRLHVFRGLQMPDKVRAGQLKIRDRMPDGEKLEGTCVADVTYRDQNNIRLSDPVGVIFSQGDKPIAAVQMTNDLDLWVSPSVTGHPRNVMAAAAVALGLYEPLQQQDTRATRRRQR